MIAPAALERDDVVDDVSGAGAGLVAGCGARVVVHEPPPLLRIAVDAVVVAGMVWSRAAARESRVGHEGDEASEKERANPHEEDGSPEKRYCLRVRRRSVGMLTPTGGEK
jgi:hypothetical protein